MTRFLDLQLPQPRQKKESFVYRRFEELESVTTTHSRVTKTSCLQGFASRTMAAFSWARTLPILFSFTI